MFVALLIASVAGFVSATLLYHSRLLRLRTEPARAASWGMVAGTAALAVAAVVELIGAPGAPPMSVSAQVVLIIGVAVGLLALLLQSWGRVLSGPFGATIAGVVAIVVLLKVTAAGAPPPAGGLRTVTIIHISATIIGFMLFIPAYILSALFIGESYRLKTKQTGVSHLPSLVGMEQAAWRLLYLGFPLYTVGILLGAVWQESASSAAGFVLRPQQVFAAASWCIFAYAIVRRLRTGWRGTRAAIAVNAAFVLTLAAVLLYMLR